jgi:hypothetical protein
MFKFSSVFDVISENYNHCYTTLNKSDIVDDLIDLLIWNFEDIFYLLVSLGISSFFYWFYLEEGDQHDIDENDDIEVNPSQQIPLICKNFKSIGNSSKSLLPFHFNEENRNLIDEFFKFFLLTYSIQRNRNLVSRLLG